MNPNDFSDLQLGDGLLVKHIHVPLRINCNKFGDILTSHIAPSPGQNKIKNKHFSALVYDSVLMTFPLSSAVLCSVNSQLPRCEQTDLNAGNFLHCVLICSEQLIKRLYRR